MESQLLKKLPLGTRGQILIKIAEIAITFETSYFSNSFCKFIFLLQTKISLMIKNKAKINNEKPIKPFETKICT